jgi:hypothetical protein
MDIRNFIIFILLELLVGACVLLLRHRTDNATLLSWLFGILAALIELGWFAVEFTFGH